VIVHLTCRQDGKAEAQRAERKADHFVELFGRAAVFKARRARRPAEPGRTEVA